VRLTLSLASGRNLAEDGINQRGSDRSGKAGMDIAAWLQYGCA
jgi:hypothetical protein